MKKRQPEKVADGRSLRPKWWRAAAYVRVSSAAQSFDMQRDAIRQKAGQRGDDIADDAWYADHASGGKLARPSLERLREHVREGKVNRLYIYRLDRLTRTGIRDTLSLVDEFQRNGVELVTVADGFEVGGPAGDVVLAVLAWAAKAERAAINERITAAREAKARRGESWGRPSRMLKSEVAKARELHESGASMRAIAVALKVPKSTVQRALAPRRGASQKPASSRRGPGLQKSRS